MKKAFLNSFTRSHFLFPAMALFLITPAYAIVVGQVDDFEDGTLMGWNGGSTEGAILSNIPNGGPLGPGDSYLEFKRDTSPFHIAVKNQVQWTGDFLNAGVTAIGMDLNHLAGSTPLTMRLMLWGDGGVWASTNTTPISTTPDWNNYVFGLTATDLVYVSGTGGTGVLADTLSTISNLQIRHDYPTPTPPGGHPPHILATLGIDNVTAIPEPATLALMIAGVLTIRKQKRETPATR